LAIAAISGVIVFSTLSSRASMTSRSSRRFWMKDASADRTPAGPSPPAASWPFFTADRSATIWPPDSALMLRFRGTLRTGPSSPRYSRTSALVRCTPPPGSCCLSSRAVSFRPSFISRSKIFASRSAASISSAVATCRALAAASSRTRCFLRMNGFAMTKGATVEKLLPWRPVSA
tara:strand:+ start:1508 stop:2032 length:525 start_codon:yes stop_codon:yes gene_type:complete